MNYPFDFRALPFLVSILLLFACNRELQRSHFDERDGNEQLSAELMRVDSIDGISEQLIEYPGFIVSFNADNGQPNWVAWELTRDECRASDVSRKLVDYSVDDAIEGCAKLEDYRGSGYDRGHMCPAGDMKWSREGMEACFKLTNMCPQARSLNNGAWRLLEEKCREWAINDSAIVIICGPIFSDKQCKYIGASEIAVPESFFKVILSPFSNPVKGIGFIMSNGYVEGGLQKSAVSIDAVEEATGYDFFSALPDDIEDEVEASCNFLKWNKKKY